MRGLLVVWLTLALAVPYVQSWPASKQDMLNKGRLLLPLQSGPNTVTFNLAPPGPGATLDASPGGPVYGESAAAEGSLVDLDLNCSGVQVDYIIKRVRYIFPALSPSVKTTLQPFRFESFIVMTNMGYSTVKSWQLRIGFHNEEIVTQLSNAIPRNATGLPIRADNGTVLMGFPIADLQNSILTSGNFTAMQLQVALVGTAFGTAVTRDALPLSMELLNDGWSLDPRRTTIKEQGSHLRVCMREKPGLNSSDSLAEKINLKPAIANKTDVSIVFDVIYSAQTTYTAQVNIYNNLRYGRIENWTMSWDWQGGEVIQKMVGAEALYTGDCLDAPAAMYYSDLQNNVHSCASTPEIVDLSYDKAINAELAIPNCCKNGTLMPRLIDPSSAVASYQLQVLKIPPWLGPELVNPPSNVRLQPKYGSFNCGLPYAVQPTLYPIPSSRRQNQALFTFQVDCNFTKPPVPTCCVSFSAVFNQTVVPCPTCACGCNKTTEGGPESTRSLLSSASAAAAQTCDPTATAPLLPWEALLMPYANRSTIVDKFNAYHHSTPLSNVAACPDNCGVNVNWHIKHSTRSSWTARMTVLNWLPETVYNWFVVVEGDINQGLDTVYSTNYTADPDDPNLALYMGLHEYNEWLLPSNETLLKPGMLQTTMLFARNSSTPEINFLQGGGFPRRIWFNGMECAMPEYFPQSGGAAGRPLHRLLLACMAILPMLVLLF